MIHTSLQAAVNRDPRTRAMFRRMDDVQKQLVQAMYLRHLKACAKLGISEEQQFLFETLTDVRKGRFETV